MSRLLDKNCAPESGKKTLETILVTTQRRVSPVFDELEEFEASGLNTEGDKQKQQEEKEHPPTPKKSKIQVRHPLAVDSLQRLFYYLGPWVLIVFATQTASAYMVAKIAHDHFNLDKIVTVSGFLLFAFVVDLIAYLILRGRIYTLFFKPGLLLLASTTIPGIAAGLLDYIYDLSWLSSPM